MADTPPPAKKVKTDGNLESVDKSILLAAQDHEKWVAERRRNWPSKQRIAEAEAERAKKAAAEPPVDPAEQQTETKQTRQPVCKFFMRGRCNAGSKCRFSHERIVRPVREPHERVYKRFEPPTKASLFVKLVQSDHDAEDERLLDFIEYLQARGEIRSIQNSE